MVQYSLDVLDFPRVREYLAGYCRTPMGCELALAVVPQLSGEWLAGEFDRVDELLAVGDEPAGVPTGDVRPLLDRAAQGGVLAGSELVRVKDACVAVRQTRQFFGQRRERVPKIWQLAAMLVDQPTIEDEVGRVLDESGEVVDSATPLLAKTRQQLRRLRNRVVSRLEELAGEHPNWYSDRPAVRRDRFVLPVRVEAREHLPGIIHESSASGHTLFIEPMESVDDQNLLAELRGIEAEETDRILSDLSGRVASARVDIEASLRVAGRLDLLLAKARFSREFQCVRPAVSIDRRIRLVGARHPLLFRRRRDMIPLDIEMPAGCRVLLISGPNAGGKTVALKTVGLLSLMAVSGIPIPAAPGSALPLFDSVYADIGDQQSLDSDLSSFTAHVARLGEIIGNANTNSLVLLDEIGSSTAPEEGAALAVAVLEHLRDCGVTSVATSHFGVLKVFVQGETAMANAAMGCRAGRPTYRLAVGLPGDSSALEIAEGAGLPKSLIERARRRLGSRWLDFDARLRELNQELDRTRQLGRELVDKERRADKARTDYEARRTAAERGQLAAAERLAHERDRFLRETRRQVENLVRQIRETGAAHEAVVAAKTFVEKELAKTAEVVSVPVSSGVDPTLLSPGDVVESRSLGRSGTVEEVKTNSVVIAFGRIKMELKPADLVKPSADALDGCQSAGTGVGAGSTSGPDSTVPFRTELDVRGLSRAEADDAVSRFLDEAVYAGVSRLVIVHGKGTGALQRHIWDALRADARVSGLRLGDPNEGGTGVTFVAVGPDGAEALAESRLPRSRGGSLGRRVFTPQRRRIG